MKRAPIGHFLPVDVPAIIQYCRLTTLLSRRYDAVRDNLASAAQRAEYLAINAQVTSLSRLLRIGPSTRNAQRDKAGRNARDHGDAFDPDGADWKDLVEHGRGGRA